MAAIPAGSCHARQVNLADPQAWEPDPACTPGATDGGLPSVQLCPVAHTKPIRPPASYTDALKRAQMKAYGDTGSPANFEEDHLIALREIDAIACFLSYDGSSSISSDDEELIRENLMVYMRRWDDEVQPLLQQLELIASPRVSDLADRVSGVLMELTGLVEGRGLFVDHYPMWCQAKDLLAVLRNGMRGELDFGPLPDSYTFRRESYWPWLSDRPTRDSYVQRRDPESLGAEPSDGPVPP